MRFLSRNYFFLLFLIIETACFILIFNFNNYQKVRFLNSSNRIFAGIYDTYNSVSSYFQLKQANSELTEQITQLQNQLQKYELNTLAEVSDSLINDSSQILSNESQGITLSDTLAFLYIPAKVINNSVNKQFNYITLDKGRNDGIEADMGIIGPGGVVGIITNVSNHYSTGPTILNTKWKVSAKIKKNDYFGSLSWEGNNPMIAQLNEIPYHVNLSIGDTIVTSGYSSVFPEGILIGYIEDFNHESGDNFYEIDIRLSTNFQTLSHVEVIKNYNINEITSIQEDTETNE